MGSGGGSAFFHSSLEVPSASTAVMHLSHLPTMLGKAMRSPDCCSKYPFTCAHQGSSPQQITCRLKVQPTMSAFPFHILKTACTSSSCDHPQEQVRRCWTWIQQCQTSSQEPYPGKLLAGI